MPRPKAERIAGFTHREISTIQNGLRVAAEKFTDHAIIIRGCGPKYEPLALQFEQQAKDSRAIADRFDAQEEQDERDMLALCGECGAEMPADAASLVNRSHTRACSLHPQNVANRDTQTGGA